MTLTVLDSSNLDAILEDAGVEVQKGPAPEPKTVVADAKPEPAPNEEQEDENGLTEAQRKELTDKMQKAIGKKHRMLKEAEEFAAAQYSERKLAEQRAAELERRLADTQKMPSKKVEESAQDKPQRQNFATEAEYLDAMIGYGVEQRLAKEREDRAREDAERRQKEILETAKGRLTKAAELVPDYMDVVSAVDVEVPTAVAGYMQKSEMLAELGYYFAKNPDILLSLGKLAPDEQLVKIGKIESTLKPFGSNEPTTPQASSNSHGQHQAAPSIETGNNPSKARNSAPVITPLNGSGASHEKDPKEFNVREEISEFAKRTGTNLGLRKRH